MNVEILNKNECHCINVVFNEDGISILDVLESDFSDFVNKFIKEKIQ